MLPMEEDIRRSRRRFPFNIQNVQSYLRRSSTSSSESFSAEKEVANDTVTVPLDRVPVKMENTLKFRRQKSSFTQTAKRVAKKENIPRKKMRKVKRGDSLASFANPLEYSDLAPETMEPLCEVPNVVGISNLSPLSTPPVSRKCKRSNKVTQPKVDCWLEYKPKTREVSNKKKETSLKLRAMLNVVNCLLEDDNRTNEKPRVKSKGCLLALKRELNFCLNNKILMIPSSPELPALYEPRSNYKEFNPKRNRYSYVKSKMAPPCEPSAYNNNECPTVDISGKVRHQTRYIPVVDPTTDIVETKLTVRPKPVDKSNETSNKFKTHARSQDEPYDILVSYRIGKSAVQHYIAPPKKLSDLDDDNVSDSDDGESKALELKLSYFLKEMFSISPKSLYCDIEKENPETQGSQGLVQLEHELDQEKFSKMNDNTSSAYYKTKSLKRGKTNLFPSKTPLISSVKLSELIYDRKVCKKLIEGRKKTGTVIDTNSNHSDIKDEHVSRMNLPKLDINFCAKLIATAESDVETLTSQSSPYHESQIGLLMKFLHEQDIKTKLKNIINDMSRNARYRKLKVSLVKLQGILDYLVAVYVQKNNVSSVDTALGHNASLDKSIYTESETDVKLNELTFTIGTIKNLLRKAFRGRQLKTNQSNVNKFPLLRHRKDSEEYMDVQPTSSVAPFTDHKRPSINSNEKVQRQTVQQKTVTVKDSSQSKQKNSSLKNKGDREHKIPRINSLISVKFGDRKSHLKSVSKRKSASSTLSKHLIRPANLKIGNIKTVISRKDTKLKQAIKKKELRLANKKKSDRNASQGKTKLNQNKKEELVKKCRFLTNKQMKKSRKSKKRSIVKVKNKKEHQIKKPKEESKTEKISNSKSSKERSKFNKTDIKVIKKSLNFKPALKTPSDDKLKKRTAKLESNSSNQGELPKGNIVRLKNYSVPYPKRNILKVDHHIKKKEHETKSAKHNCRLKESVIKEIERNPLAFKKVAQEVLERTFSRDSLKTILLQVINSGYIDEDNESVRKTLAKEASAVKPFYIDERDRINNYLQSQKHILNNHRILKGQPPKMLLTNIERLEDFSKNEGKVNKSLACTNKMVMDPSRKHQNLDESEKKSALLFHRLCTALTRSRNKIISNRMEPIASKNVTKAPLNQEPIEKEDLKKSQFLI